MVSIDNIYLCRFERNWLRNLCHAIGRVRQQALQERQSLQSERPLECEQFERIDPSRAGFDDRDELLPDSHARTQFGLRETGIAASILDNFRERQIGVARDDFWHVFPQKADLPIY